MKPILRAVLLLMSGSLWLFCQKTEEPFTVYLTPNSHGTVSGWLVDFDDERSHVVNNYGSHMDRVDTDPNYALAFSEAPNALSLMQLAPERMRQLQRQVAGGRTELVNGFFLEPTINLSGGEALVEMGVLGARWYDEVFRRRPHYAWMIDVCGVHPQMPQIVHGLGLDALFFSRDNPAGKTAFWWKAPDGSRTLAISFGLGYATCIRFYKTEKPLTLEEMQSMRKAFEKAREMTPSRHSVLLSVGGGDYSLAPRRPSYPTEFLAAWSKQFPNVHLRFAVPSEYIHALEAEVQSGQTVLPEYEGGAAYSYDAFWMNMPEIKRSYRHSEHLQQAAEFLATAASLKTGFSYPSQALYDSWLCLLMNMDRNVLWGAGAGTPFTSPAHWNVQDRFDLIDRNAGAAIDTSLQSLSRQGRAVTIFNPLNWRREDPVELTVPPNAHPENATCESRPESGKVVCAVKQPSAGLTSIALAAGTSPAAQEQAFSETVETRYYRVRFDRKTGAIVSLQDRATGKEYLGGAANVVMAESVAGILKDPANAMVRRPLRKLVDSTSNHSSAWKVASGPLATTLTARSQFLDNSSVERRITLYRDFPRIDFDTAVDLHTEDLVISVDFPLAGVVVQRTRGVPYGFASTDPRQDKAPGDYFISWEYKAFGFSNAIMPAVRWSDYGLAAGGGVALLDRGLTCHELNGSTVTLALLNAQSSYRKLVNEILAGQGRHSFSYALWPHTGTWQEARIAQHAWEFNAPAPAAAGRSGGPAQSFLETSPNVIVEAVRRVGPDIEVRFVEATGAAGVASIKLNLPHGAARLTNLMGEQPQPIRAVGHAYHIRVRPQQIVTLRFAAGASVETPPAIRAWDPLVPSKKLPALHHFLNAQGYPGEEPKW